MNSFGSKVFTLFVSLLSGMVVIVGCVFWTSAPALAAAQANDPMVVVVRDTTSSARCEITWSIGFAPHARTIKTTTCPAGSVLGTFHVPLSQAIAAGEKYVKLPSQNASLKTQTQVKQQIFALFQTVEARYHPSVSSSIGVGGVKPFCGGTIYEVSADWYPSFDNSTLEYSAMSYTRCGGNVINLLQGYAGLVSGRVYNWDHDQYLSGYYQRNCQAIGRTIDNQGIYDNRTAGYDYRPYISSGNHCTPFDSYSYFNIGPAN